MYNIYIYIGIHRIIYIGRSYLYYTNRERERKRDVLFLMFDV